MGSYYNTVILPAKVRSPRWKPNVENSVGVCTRDILVEMNEMKFFSLKELNQELLERVIERNDQNFYKKEYSRSNLYLNEEKPVLMPLPEERFALFDWETTKIRADQSVYFDKNYYSIITLKQGTVVNVRASENKVYTPH